MNHNAAYVYSVDGVTIWERLRVIRGFLSGREKALMLAELSLEEIDYKIETSKNEFHKRKLKIEIPDLLDNIQYAKEEISFLKEMESNLAINAEVSRIYGKTDREMYELNFFLELETRIVNKAKAEILSDGRVSSTTLIEISKCPKAMLELEKSNLIQNGVLLLETFNDNKQVKLLTDAINI
jgi:predicted RNase H-like nuclease (RuvC/YqgF family)